MPRAPMTACAHPGCPALVARGRYCDTHARPKAAFKMKNQAAPRLTSSQRGYDYAWQQLRAAYVAEHPLCEDCQAQGRVTPVAEVHHLQSVAEYPHLRLDWHNLRSLCKRCHEQREGFDRKRW